MIRYEIRQRRLEIGGVRPRGWRAADPAPASPGEKKRVTLDLDVTETDFGFRLTWHDDAEEVDGNTMHATVEDAREQARLSFGVRQDEWLSAGD